MSELAGPPSPATAVAVAVEKLIGRGRGLAHHQGRPWMVAGALPGEDVLAMPARQRAGVVEARAVALCGRPHPARLVEACPHAERCGGCDWPHVEAGAAAKLKAEVAAEASRRFAVLAERLAAAPVQTSPLAHRLRVRLHWDPERRLLGFYGPHSWSVSDIAGCRVLSPRLTAARTQLASALAATCPEAADLEWLEDLEGDVAVAALRPARRGSSSIAPSWVAPESLLGGVVEGLWALGPASRLGAGWGRSAVTMRLPVPLEVPIGAFFQVNRHLARWLFEKVSALAGPEPVPAFDLHAGVGFLAAAAAAAVARELDLVEPQRQAALAARGNLPSARVAVGKTAEAFLAGRRRLPRRALVLLDPPRAGLSEALRRRVSEWRPERVMMLSCDPATWSRDAAHLLDSGFRLAHLVLVDLFPSTHHVEIVSVLESG